MEHRPRTHQRAGEYREFSVNPTERVQAFGSKLIAFLDSSKVSKKHKKDVLEDAYEVSDRVGNVAAALIVVGALGFMAEKIHTSGNTSTPRYSITEVNTHDGQKVYHHEDRETTQIIDWLSGYAPSPWPESERVKFDREHIRQHAHDMQEELPKNFDALNEHQLAAFVKKEAEDEAGVPIKATKEQLREHERWAKQLVGGELKPGAYAPNPELYRKLWQLQEKVGAPRIRWAYEEKSQSDDTRKINAQGRSHYVQSTNTIYLDKLDSAFEDIVAEDSHADQYVNNRVKALAMEAQDMQRVTARISTEKDFRLSYDETYEEPGSIEYNAHREIEPKLWKELGDAMPKDE